MHFVRNTSNNWPIKCKYLYSETYFGRKTYTIYLYRRKVVSSSYDVVIVKSKHGKPMNLKRVRIEENYFPSSPADSKFLKMSWPVPIIKYRYEIDLASKKRFSPWNFRKRTVRSSFPKRHSFLIVSISNISSHLADLQLKILIQVQGKDEQLWGCAFVGWNKKYYL